VEPQIIHQRRERHAAQLRESRQALDPLRFERLDLGDEAWATRPTSSRPTHTEGAMGSQYWAASHTGAHTPPPEQLPPPMPPVLEVVPPPMPPLPVVVIVIEAVVLVVVPPPVPAPPELASMTESEHAKRQGSDPDQADGCHVCGAHQNAPSKPSPQRTTP
jgi:hypothetical protein